MGDRILVVAAHPDDEALGAGGTIARHAARGDEVHVLFLADGETSRPGGEHRTLGRESAAGQACRILGAQAPRCLGLPDNRLDSIALLDVIQPLETVMRELQPQVIYTHHGGDLNLDHQTAYRAVMTACRPLPGAAPRRILAFEVASSTEWYARGQDEPFVPTFAVDIQATLDRKLQALRAYDAEMRPFPHPRSYEAVEYLSRLRGAQFGLVAAEAFVVVRDLWS